MVFIVFVERKKPGDNDQSRDQRLLVTREETGELRGKLIPINLTSEFFFVIVTSSEQGLSNDPSLEIDTTLLELFEHSVKLELNKFQIANT